MDREPGIYSAPDLTNTKAERSLLRSAIWPFIASLLGVLVGLWFEYRSGIFTKVDDTGIHLGGWTRVFEWTQLFLALVAAPFILRSVRLAVSPTAFREAYSLPTLPAIGLTLWVSAFGFVTGVMPWHFLVSLVQETPPTSHWSERVLLVAISAVFLRFALQKHSSWQGKVSVGQVQRKKGGTFRGLFEDYRVEVKRRWKLQPQHLPYTVDDELLTPALAPTTEADVPWKETAREILGWTSPAYSFDRATDWHDIPGCWIGEVLSTRQLVCLTPTIEPISKEYVLRIHRHTLKVARERKTSLYEMIFVHRGTTSTAPGKLPFSARFETEWSLLDKAVNLEEYKRWIRWRATEERLPESPLTAADVYEPCLLQPDPGTPNLTETRSVESYLTEWLGEPGQRQLALLGSFGQGKSTSALMFAHRLLQEPESGSRIPILLELRGLSPRNQTPLGLLAAWGARFGLGGTLLLYLLKQGRLLLILEGFDEIELIGDADIRLQHFRLLWQFAYPKAKILITGRPNFFFDDQELRAALGLTRPQGNAAPYCEAIRLAPFTIAQISRVLESYPEATREAIPALAASNDSFYDLVSRPSLLHMVASLWERERLQERTESLTSASVIGLFIERSYRRQGAKHQENPATAILNTAERQYFMRGIATRMATRSGANQISARDLLYTIDNLLKAIPDNVSREVSAMSGEATVPLQTRISTVDQKLEAVRTDVRACGLLVDDPSAPGTFKFGHKSFLEFLYADVCRGLIFDSDSDGPEAIVNSTSGDVLGIVEQPQALSFLVEMAAARDRQTSDAEYRHRLLRAVSGGSDPFFGLYFMIHTFSLSSRVIWFMYAVASGAMLSSISASRFLASDPPGLSNAKKTIWIATAALGTILSFFMIRLVSPSAQRVSRVYFLLAQTLGLGKPSPIRDVIGRLRQITAIF